VHRNAVLKGCRRRKIALTIQIEDPLKAATNQEKESCLQLVEQEWSL